MNQQERMIEHLWQHRHKGSSYHELMHFSNCPWKRIAELEQKGYTFRRWQHMHLGRLTTQVRLLSRPR